MKSKSFGNIAKRIMYENEQKKKCNCGISRLLKEQNSILAEILKAIKKH